MRPSMRAAVPSAGCEPRLAPEKQTLAFTQAMRILIFTLVLLLAWLQYRLWVGEGSLAEIHALKVDIARQSQELAQLRARNQALAAEVANLKTGNEALEERARMDLGMIKPGEVFLQVIEGQPRAAAAEPGPNGPADGQPEHKPGQKQDPSPASKLDSKPSAKPDARPPPKAKTQPAPTPASKPAPKPAHPPAAAEPSQAPGSAR